MNLEENPLITRGCSVSKKSDTKTEPVFTHGCCKMDAFNWLENIELPQAQSENRFCEVRFKNNRKDFFRNFENLSLKIGDFVAVESTPGHDIGIVTLTGKLVVLQMKKKKVNVNSLDVKKIYRRARLSDIEKWMHAASLEEKSITESKKIVSGLNLDMKINDVEYQGDKTKAFFYYTANERVDFRELIKLLAEKFFVRIEMRQIGARQEAGRLGGLGTCGRELCCSTWISKFKSVSTNSARSQQLSSNPQRLTGQCSKLKCCLNYEVDFYAEALKDFPDSDIHLLTKNGEAIHQKTDVIKKLMWYIYKEKNASHFYAIPTDKVKEIIEMNKKGVKPVNLDDYIINKEEKKAVSNINEDDIARFDNNY